MVAFLRQKGKIMEKQYLTEENYQRVNKKFKTISLVVFIVGLIIGLGLIVFGIIKTNEANQINEERAAAAEAEVNAKVAAAEQRLSEVQSELGSLKPQYDAKESECDSLNMQDPDWFAKKSQCQRESSAIYSDIMDLESEEFQLEHANFTVYYDKADSSWCVVLYGVGGFIILASAIASLSIWLITKRRTLLAYHAQSVMPVAKEGIDEITPTAANAAGTVAESLAEGITRGIKNGKQ